MIVISVNQHLELVTNVLVQDVDHDPHLIDAIIDTGFSDCLTLDKTFIEQMDLSWQGLDLVTLADGRTVACNTFDATIEWDGTTRTIKIQEADSDPLVGTELLRGYNLKAEFIPGGSGELSRI